MDDCASLSAGSVWGPASALDLNILSRFHLIFPIFLTATLTNNAQASTMLLCSTRAAASSSTLASLRVLPPSQAAFRSIHSTTFLRNASGPPSASPLELALRAGLKTAMKARDKPAASTLKVGRYLIRYSPDLCPVHLLSLPPSSPSLRSMIKP
jgi:hypothetical protein